MTKDTVFIICFVGLVAISFFAYSRVQRSEVTCNVEPLFNAYIKANEDAKKWQDRLKESDDSIFQDWTVWNRVYDELLTEKQKEIYKSYWSEK